MKSRILRIVLAIVVVLFVSFFIITSCIRQTPAGPSSPSDLPEETPSAAPDESDAAPEETPSDTPEDPENTEEQTPPDEETPEPVEETPEPVGPVVQYGEPVEDDWFSDAAFLGNSLVDGFRLFSGLNCCDYYAATSMTVLGAGPLISQMAAKQYGKVYILLGINEIGFDADYFKEQYASMLDTIMEQQPDADIYIMGISPVSEHKSTTDSTFTMDRVRLYNEKLCELAEEKGCYYVDLVEALADETGYLPADVTSDGVHFSASHYQVWLEYLRTHHA